jgi:hypothetical protein
MVVVMKNLYSGKGGGTCFRGSARLGGSLAPPAAPLFRIISYFAILLLLATGCDLGAREKDKRKFSESEIVQGVSQVGFITHPALKEDSGIAASRKYPGIFWTHTDGAKRPALFAISRDGAVKGEFTLANIPLHDWEDIAIDDTQTIYIGDIGNNDAARDELAVFAVDEPDPAARRGAISAKNSWRLRFPKKPFDCESLFVWKNFGYVISKVFNDEHAALYRFPLEGTNVTVTLEQIAVLRITTPVTGATISSDGKKLALVSRSGPFLFEISREGDFRTLADPKPFHLKFPREHIEGCTFVPEGLLVTSEDREIFLFRDPVFRP